MGLFDGVRRAAGFAQYVLTTEPKWAKILAIESRTGPFAQIRLEMHVGDREPYEHVTSAVIPRGVTPEVGQHVAIVNHTGPGSTRESWGIRWKREPQYGHELDGSKVEQGALAAAMGFQERMTAAYVQRHPEAAPAITDDKRARFDELVKLRAQGQISADEYDRAVAGIYGPPPSA